MANHSTTSIYHSLESFLSEGKWKEADEETTRLMLQLGDQNRKGYLDVEDCRNFPKEELRTIDKLWLKYSNGKFGFSVQKEIYLEVGGKLNDYHYDSYKKMSDRIGWSDTETAPRGYFPVTAYDSPRIINRGVGFVDKHSVNLSPKRKIWKGLYLFSLL